MLSQTRDLGSEPLSRRARAGASVPVVELLALAVAAVAAVTATGRGDWAPAELVVALVLLAFGGQLLASARGGIWIGPETVVIVCAIALLGPAPAALVAAAAALAWALRTRPILSAALDNLCALVVCAVVGAFVFRAFVIDAPSGLASLSASALVFAVAALLTIVGTAALEGCRRLRNGTAFSFDRARFFWAVLIGGASAGAVIVYEATGLLALTALVAMLWLFRWRFAALLDVVGERDELLRQVEVLESQQTGAIRVMVETLGMRDRMTARHSAAVARFAKALAASAGLSTRDQEIAHTAGLLHDLGKFTFPDHTLTGPRLTEEDWELIRSHPSRGADIIGRVRGYEDVAEIVLSHHERVDGDGYPRGLVGEEIPALARILSVADCFDAMTARDSYRRPMSFDAATQELRRVAGTQLDRRYVELFITLICGVDVVQFDHSDDAEFEAELSG